MDIAARGRWFGALLLVVCGGVAAAVLWPDPAPERGPQPAATTHPVALEVVARIPARRAPQALAVTDDSVWVTTAGTLRLLRFDSETGRQTARVNFGAVPAGVAVAGGDVWVGFAEGSEILRVDEEDPTRTPQTIFVGRTPQAVAVAQDGAGVWVAALNEPAAALVDAARGKVVRRIDLEDRFPAAVAVGFGKVWVPDVVADILLEVDPKGADIQREVRVGRSPTSVVAGEGAVWIGNFGSETVSRFDPRAGRVTGGVRIGGPVGALAIGGGYVWATEQENGRLVAIDSGTGQIAGEIDVGRVPQGVAVGPDGSIWVVVQGDHELVRVAVR